MRKFVPIIIGFLLLGAVSQAQQVTGNVKDQQGKGLEKSTVSLLRAKDSSIVKLSVTTDNGHFSLIVTQPGKYLVSATHVGYKRIFSNVFELEGAGDMNLPDFAMAKATADLKEVTVTSLKPMVEVKADKTIVNVEGTINAVGNDALELLRKSPGVMIDKDDNISLLGKNGVAVYIDGKPSPLSGTDLSAFLKNLQSAQIESIEIITNPSAKYDAAGNAGIINIKLKKNKAFGMNGSANIGYGQAIYGKFNGGFAINYRNQNINLFGNYNYNHADNVNHFSLSRALLDSTFNQKSSMHQVNTGHGFKAGLDYFINKVSTIGVMVNGNLNENSFTNFSRTPIVYVPTGITNRILIADNNTHGNRNNVNTNINYRYADPKGRELNVDADWGLFRIRTNQLQPNYYYDASETSKISEFIYRFITPTNINIYSLKADYETNFEKGKLGVGFKNSLVKTSNNFGRYNVVGGNDQLDLSRSNQFDYSENINAGYLNYVRSFKTTDLQAGLRVENTNSHGDSYGLNGDASVNKGSKQTFKRNYTGLFPSVAFTFKKNPMSQWGIAYSRRIDRPAYQDLNPFEFKLDEYTFQKGNTKLRPQYTNNISITNTYKYKLTSKLTYSHVNDVFTQLVDTAEKSKAFLSKQNLATQNIVSLNISYPFSYKSYSVFINVNSFYSHYRADFGGGNRIINLDVFSWAMFTQHTLKIGKKGWVAEASAFYNAPTLWQGTFKSKSIWGANAGLSKTVLKGKGTLKAAVSDIFYTQKFAGESKFSGQTVAVNGSGESRQLRLNFSYRFGSNTVKAARNRKLGSEDENNRTNSSGGIGNQ